MWLAVAAAVIFVVLAAAIIVWAGCRPLAKHYTTTIQVSGPGGPAVGDCVVVSGYRWKVLRTNGTTVTMQRVKGRL